MDALMRYPWPGNIRELQNLKLFPGERRVGLAGPLELDF
jgi:transcriptional regulator with GAF, ATPase, and Fis domain